MEWKRKIDSIPYPLAWRKKKKVNSLLDKNGMHSISFYFISSYFKELFEQCNLKKKFHPNPLRSNSSPFISKHSTATALIAWEAFWYTEFFFWSMYTEFNNVEQ